MGCCYGLNPRWTGVLYFGNDPAHKEWLKVPKRAEKTEKQDSGAVGGGAGGGGGG